MRAFVAPLSTMCVFMNNYNATDMKKLLGTVLASLFSFALMAQDFAGYSDRTTVYETFQPARVTLTTGSVNFQKEANVFLKNGKLLFKKGNTNMEADMRQIASVEFSDKFYVCIDEMLATVIDTVGKNRILCTTLIDLVAYENQKVNDRMISNVTMGGNYVDASSAGVIDSDYLYPLVNKYFFEINGKIMEAHERVIKRMLPKEKRSRFEFLMKTPDFTLADKECLHQVLELFNKEKK